MQLELLNRYSEYFKSASSGNLRRSFPEYRADQAKKTAIKMN